MKGFSLTQPWATLVAVGAKAIETRSWSTSYRGPLAIHAAKGFPQDCQALCCRDPFATALIAAGYDRAGQLPTGVILALATLDNVFATDALERALSKRFDERAVRELAFGDYSPGRFGWVLRDVRRLAEPVPAAHLTRDGQTKPGGALGLWTIAPEVLEQIARQAVAA